MRVDKNKNRQRSLKHSLKKQIKECEHHLSQAPLRQKDVHAARKGVKKIRAGLRLIKNCLPNQDFNKADLYFRSLSKGLSPLRDSHVLTHTLNMALRNSPEIPAKEVSQLKTWAKTYKKKEEQVYQHPDELHKKIKKVSPLILVAKPSKKDLEERLKKSYKKTRKIYYHMCQDTHDTNVHDYRKKIKTLLNELRLFKKNSEELKSTLLELKFLGDLLGHHHDLAFLETALKEENTRASKETLYQLIQTIEINKEHLLRKTLSKSALLFKKNWKEYKKEIRPI